MNATPPVGRTAPTRLVAWGGAVLYPLTLLIVVGGGANASAPLQAVGSLLATSLLSGLTRRRSTAALVLTLLGTTSVIFATTDLSQTRFVSYFAVDIVVGYMVATRRQRAAIIAVSVSLLVQSAVVMTATHDSNKGIPSVLIFALAMATACMIGLLNRERRRHAVEMRTQEVAEAVTAERLRIARELHDMVAHSIGIIAIQAGVGSRVIETQPGEAREALRAIESTSRETLSGLRRTLVSLRQADPSTPERSAPRAPTPGLADVDRLATMTAGAGVHVDVRRHGAHRPLPPDIDLSAYRIVQEAVTNVVRHAGTGRCQVTIGYGEADLTVEIVDDGHGATTTGHGFGLVGMRERIGLLHGHFSAGPRPEGGFRVLARLPLPEPATPPVEAR